MSIWRSSYSDPDSGAAYQRRHHPCRVKPPGLSVKLERDKRYVSLFGRSRARQDVRDSAATRVSCMPRYVCLALWSSRRARYKGHPDGSYRWRQADRHQRPGEMDAGVLASRIRNDEWPLRLSGAFAGRKSTRSSGGGSSCTEVAELLASSPSATALSANTPVTYGRAYGAAIWFSGWMPCGRPATHTRRCRCPSFRPTRWRRSCGTARSGVTAPATNSPRSSPARSPPPPAKILKNLTSLLMANLN